MTDGPFAALGLHHSYCDTVASMGFEEPSDIQRAAIPEVLAHKDILGIAQTGTGKTHTMEGFKYNVGDPQRGIIPRSMEEIFKFIQMQSNKNTTFMVRVSYLQIYNEIISDLLKVERLLRRFEGLLDEA